MPGDVWMLLWTDLLEQSNGLELRFLVSLCLILLGLLLRRAAVRAVGRADWDPARRYQVGKTVNSIILVLVTALLLQIWLTGSIGIGTWLGIASAGLAVALRDPIVNVAGWMMILVRQPFKLGDRIQIGDISGDVVDVGPQTFSLLEIGNWVRDDQSTGRLIHVPNGRVFRDAVASYNQGFEYIWNELRVVVTFESDWQRAREVLGEIAVRHGESVVEEARNQIRSAAQVYMIRYKHLTPIVWVAVEDIGVALTVRYLCRVRQRRSTASAIWSDILLAFAAEPKVEFAYPTTRWYGASAESKPDLRPGPLGARQGNQGPMPDGVVAAPHTVPPGSRS